jgi:hypothetical protein
MKNDGDEIKCYSLIFNYDRCSKCKYFIDCLKRQIEVGNETLFKNYELFD